MTEQTTPQNIHSQKKKKNLLTALVIVLFFGGIAAFSIIYNILIRG